MVRFIDNREEEEETSRWRNLMQQTRQRFREIWSGGEKLPDRD
jgi:hypothetical protein